MERVVKLRVVIRDALISFEGMYNKGCVGSNDELFPTFIDCVVERIVDI